MAFAVHKATRQTHQLRVHDWKLEKCIARYLKGTQGMKLLITPTIGSHGTIKLESHSDADFSADKNYRKSLTRYVILMNGMPVS